MSALGFATFFSVFEAGRQVARNARKFLSRNNVLTEREWFARTVQAVIIICGGSLAGLMYGIIGRPFDVSLINCMSTCLIRSKGCKKHHLGTENPMGQRVEIASQECLAVGSSSCKITWITSLSLPLFKGRLQSRRSSEFPKQDQHFAKSSSST